MNKLGYKQKGIPMLKSPLNIEGVTGVGGSKTDADRLAKYNADKKIERTQDRENTAARNEAIKGIFKGVFTKGTGVGSGSRNKRKSASGGKLNESNKNSVSTNSGSLSLNTDSKLGNRRAEIGNLVSQVKTTIPGGSDTLPPPPPKAETSNKATGSMKNYSIGSQRRFDEYAARGWKQDATTVVKGSPKQDATTVVKNKISDENSSSFAGEGEQPGFKNTQSTKTTEKKPAAKIKSNKDIRKEKRANIKGGMSRQEARLKKTQSKAASAKAKTNRTIKSIDPTKAKSADTGAKQTSARATRAKAKRLERRAERLKGRVNASKVSK